MKQLITQTLRVSSFAQRSKRPLILCAIAFTSKCCFLGIVLGWFSLSGAIVTDSGPFVGWMTNGAAVLRLYLVNTQVLPGLPLSYCPPPENLPPEVRSAMLLFRSATNVRVLTNTTSAFDHFLPESLNHAVWTNFFGNTNGKSMAIWSRRTRPADWPASPALVTWNPNSLIWGMKGLTAICPCWEWEGPPGCTPITALTRRHGYARGHSMGPDRFGTELAGRKVWFLTTNNLIVEARILRQVVRTRETSNRDYTLVLFAHDLPPSIEPMRVMAASDVFAMPHCKYWYVPGTPSLLLKTEQGGNVSADVPGFTVDTMKVGDSGSPDMLPLPGELVFLNGRTSSGPSPKMQADMDELCRLEGLDPAKYQLQYPNLSNYPTY
jgi:hypothetical protein